MRHLTITPGIANVLALTRRGSYCAISVFSLSSWSAAHAGRYPSTEEGLDSLNGIRSRDLLDGWGQSFEYIGDSQGFRVTSSGPDGQLGNTDDLWFDESGEVRPRS